MGYTVDVPALRETLQEIAKDDWELVEEILERVGTRTVELLQSYTGEKKRDGRRMHPGGWADKTFNLMRGYRYEVMEQGSDWVLVIGNTARHAHLIEMRDGLFVVAGVTDPGGPVEEALQQAIRELAPGWKSSASLRAGRE